MQLTAKHLKAINWYCQSNGLKPALSTPPIIYFTNRTTGATIKKELQGVVLEYNAWNEEDKKQRAREKQQAERRR